MAMTAETDSWVPRDTFGGRLLEIRRQLKLSQKEAAKRCGLNDKAWATWERPVKPASPQNMNEVVQKIEEGLGVNPVWLMWGGARSKWTALTALRLIPGGSSGPAKMNQMPLPFLSSVVDK